MDWHFGPVHMDRVQSARQEWRNVEEVLAKFYRDGGTIRVQGYSDGFPTPRFRLVERNGAFIRNVSL